MGLNDFNCRFTARLWSDLCVDLSLYVICPQKCLETI